MIGCPGFLCANQKCLPSEMRCNGENNCGDNSDEEQGCVGMEKQHEYV